MTVLGLVLGFGPGCFSSKTHTTMHAPGSEGAFKSEGGDVEPAELAAFNDQERKRILLVKPWVDNAAMERSLEPNLINAVIWVESRFQPKAKSPAGARGLMQLMPSTAAALARSMGRSRAASYDPEFNIAAGSLYLRKMMDRYEGELELALAAYNAGAGNVDKWMREDGELPPRSKEYVALVLEAKRRFDGHPLEPVVPGETMIAVAPKADEGPVPVQRPGDDKKEEPEPAYVPAPPTRFDLDRVESEYEPAPPPEPPLADTPWPPRKPEPVDPAPAEIDDDAPLPAVGVLPSVLD